jgi:3-oxoacyl-[acyl-carrier-protein] synthase II
MSAPVVASPAAGSKVKAEPLVLSAWSTLSPYGAGADLFTDGIRSGRSAIRPLDREAFPGPFERGGVLADFSPVGFLGKRGTRSMDRLTAIAVSTLGLLVEQCGPDLTVDAERVGLVLGTGSGSVQSIMDFTRDSLAGEKPYHVDPALFPNTVMNKAAGQSAIWHGIKGPNTTITGDWATGLLALSYAIRLVRGGHCDRVLCGAVEEHSTQRAWLEWHSGANAGTAPALAEGGAFFLLEPLGDALRAGRTPAARVLATRFRGFTDPADARSALSACVSSALEQAGVRGQDVRVVAPSAAEGQVGTDEEAAVNDVLGGASPRWVRCRPLIGDASSVSVGFQMAAALSVAGEGPFGDGDLALITTIDRDGMVGCALLGGHGEAS